MLQCHVVGWSQCGFVLWMSWLHPPILTVEAADVHGEAASVCSKYFRPSLRVKAHVAYHKKFTTPVTTAE